MSIEPCICGKIPSIDSGNQHNWKYAAICGNCGISIDLYTKEATVSKWNEVMRKLRTAPAPEAA